MIGAPYCLECRHYRPHVPPPDGVPRPGFTSWTCNAFPAGIPKPIIEGPADHRKPYEGDHGIRFAQAPGAEPPDWKAYDLPAEVTA